MPDTDLRQYLDPRVLGRIGRLDLAARLVMQGFLSGLHRSPFHGFAVEFAEHREYVPGDDTRHIDWKVWSKTDRLYIKQYEEETNLRATFLLDASASMQYASGEGLSKYRYGACVAAALSMLLLNQQDAVGLATFDEEVRQWVGPSANPNHLRTLISAMDRAECGQKTSIEPICHALAEKLGRRGLVCLVSDLLCDVEGLARGLHHLRHRQHEVLVLQVLDADELSFPFQGPTRFEGLEDAGHLLAEPRALRRDYLAAMEAHCSEIKRRCLAQRIDYKRISTADHLGAALASFLAARSAARRKGR